MKIKQVWTTVTQLELHLLRHRFDLDVCLYRNVSLAVISVSLRTIERKLEKLRHCTHVYKPWFIQKWVPCENVRLRAVALECVWGGTVLNAISGFHGKEQWCLVLCLQGKKDLWTSSIHECEPGSPAASRNCSQSESTRGRTRYFGASWVLSLQIDNVTTYLTHPHHTAGSVFLLCYVGLVFFF